MKKQKSTIYTITIIDIPETFSEFFHDWLLPGVLLITGVVCFMRYFMPLLMGVLP